eukprot:gnl/TRDRNA2_/TRDRNA2_184469_c0_seq1.p1 gnl/TRDRNA2_/TRDRNA2_184469_c0~~gnl/TRDRNA2_/TRDRNA2_184469_c0_seq1.p1  ORF type:complete len:217 (+),score=27.60 gnl/TRDRNA2_/TRDRNA2_184469_c0_seq1:94-744(+)
MTRPLVALLALVANEAAALVRKRSFNNKTMEPKLTSFELGCYYEEDDTPAGEFGGKKGRSYRGMVSTTVSGFPCQKWTDVHPWAEAAKIKPLFDLYERTSTDPDSPTIVHYGNGIGNHNYCRNPDSSEASPWCFTMNPTVKKELCSIPKCDPEPRDFKSEAADLATKVATGLDCKCRAQLYGAYTTTADTSVTLAQVRQQWPYGRDSRDRPCLCKH